MGLDDQTIRLALQVLGQPGVDSLRASVADLKGKMEAVGPAFAKGDISAKEMEREFKSLSGEYARQNDLLAKLEAELGKQTVAANAQAVALANAGASGSAWGEVMGSAAVKAADATATIQRETQAVQSNATATARMAMSRKDAAAAAVEAQTRTSGLNMAVRGLGYGISDVFSNNGPLGQKLAGFANNVAGITTGILMALGKLTPATAAAAAGLEIAFTALGAALTAGKINSIADVFALFGEVVERSADRVSTLTRRIDELEAKDHKIPIEVVELENARKEVEGIKSALEAVDRLRKSQQHYEKESGEEIGKTLVELSPGGPRAVMDKLEADETAKILAGSVVIKEANAKLAKASADVARLDLELKNAVPGLTNIRDVQVQRDRAADRAKAAERDISAAQAAAAEQAKSTVGKELAAAQSGAGAEQAAGQKALAGRLEKSGFGGLAENVRSLSPDQIKAADEAAAEERRRDEAANFDRELRDARDKREAEAAKQDDALAERLTKDGERHEAAAETQRAKDRAAAAKKEEATRKAHDHERDADVKRISGTTTIDEQIALTAAQMRQMGGMVTASGHFRPLNELEQHIALADHLTGALRKSPVSRGLSDSQVRAVASKMTGQAFTDVDRQNNARAAELAQQGAGESARSVAMMQTMDASMQNLAAAVQHLQAKNDAMNRQLAQTYRRTQVLLRPGR